MTDHNDEEGGQDGKAAHAKFLGKLEIAQDILWTFFRIECPIEEIKRFSVLGQNAKSLADAIHDDLERQKEELMSRIREIAEIKREFYPEMSLEDYEVFIGTMWTSIAHIVDNGHPLVMPIIISSVEEHPDDHNAACEMYFSEAETHWTSLGESIQIPAQGAGATGNRI